MSFAVLSLTVLSMLRQVTSVAPTTYANNGLVAAAWYTDTLPLSNVSWDKYNTLIYSFATTTPNISALSLNGSDPSLLPQFVDQAHKNGVAAHISVGGWNFFSSYVATPENRKNFVQTVVNFAEQYELDGINFNWEHPNHQGIGCNVNNANDTENFLSFLQELHADPVGSQLTLSAATPVVPFRDTSGNPSTNMSGFAEVLDYIAVMDFITWGGWSAVVGPNAPLNDTCATPAHQVGSAVSAVKAWSAAGIPVNKIVFGVAAYGHSFSVPPYEAFASGSKTELVAYPVSNSSNQPLGDAQSSTGSTDVCGNHQGPDGTFTLKGLVDGGFLTTGGNPAPGIHYRFDDCSQTPYVYNQTSEVMISFDDARSFAAKGNYIKDTGLRGFSMWQAGGDYQDLLLDSIRNAAGYNTVSVDRRDCPRNWCRNTLQGRSDEQ